MQLTNNHATNRGNGAQFRTLVRTVAIIDLTTIAVVSAGMWLAGWRNPRQIASAITFAGFAVALVAAAVLTGGSVTGTPDLRSFVITGTEHLNDHLARHNDIMTINDGLVGKLLAAGASLLALGWVLIRIW